MRIETKFNLGEKVRYYVGEEYVEFEIHKISILFGYKEPCYHGGLILGYSSKGMSDFYSRIRHSYFVESTLTKTASDEGLKPESGPTFYKDAVIDNPTLPKFKIVPSLHAHYEFDENVIKRTEDSLIYDDGKMTAVLWKFDTPNIDGDILSSDAIINWDYAKKVTQEVAEWPDWKKEGRDTIDHNHISMWGDGYGTPSFDMNLKEDC